MEKLIADLKEQIQNCVNLHEDLDSASFDLQEGVLIAANEAKRIVEALEGRLPVSNLMQDGQKPLDSMKPYAIKEPLIGVPYDSFSMNNGEFLYEITVNSEAEVKYKKTGEVSIHCNIRVRAKDAVDVFSKFEFRNLTAISIKIVRAIEK